MNKQRILNFGMAMLFLFTFLAFPVSVWADDPPATDTTQTTPPPLWNDPNSQPTSLTCDSKDYSKLSGILAPTGAGASTFYYHFDTCLWQNNYYTWDPVTKDYTPTYNTDYTFNPATGNYETTRYVFDPTKGDYEPVIISVSPTNLLNGANPSGGPAADSATTTGPGSTTGSNNNANNNLVINSNLNVILTNKITQQAFSGDVNVLKNTYAGDATSGDASDIINILNMLQATWDIGGAGELMTFVTNINGDVTGDLLLNPNLITGPGSVSTSNSNTNNNVTVNNQANGTINNDVTMVAGSGDVNVSQNTGAGNATSGNAQAIANLVNMIDSAIFAGKSFIGVININGNLNGDILLPPNFLDQLIASGAPSATITISRNVTTNVDVNATSNQQINNNVNLNAQSGNVDASGNTIAGNATTGTATTKLTLFNLTGRQVDAANSILVFVNVVGHWVGMILDAPGANSAAFCGGQCSSTTNVNTNATLNDTSNQTINNNLDLSATSGNVKATGNTGVGNATSGNASASANILNIENSKLSLSNWFGILFINVLGTWNGSFGVNTAAGNLPSAGGVGGGSNVPQVFRFVVPKTDGSAASVNGAVSNLLDQASEQSQKQQGVVAGTSGNGPTASTTVPKSSKWIIPLVSTVVGLMLVGGEQLASLSRKYRFANQFKTGVGQIAHSLRLLLF